MSNFNTLTNAKKIRQSDLKPMEQVTYNYRAEIDAAHTLEDVCNPLYWSDVAGQSFQGKLNSIEAVWKDLSQMAELVVLDYGKTHARVFVKNHYVFNKGKEIAADKEAQYSVQFADTDGWRVVRKSDSEIIDKGFATKDLAIEALEKYLKSIKG